MAVFVASWLRRAPQAVTVASKGFTESVILGELLAEQMRRGGVLVEHKAQLGGSRVLFNALQAGDLDAYPEYTGTLMRELLSDRKLETIDQLRAALDGLGLTMSQPLGFNNTYALGMRKAHAAKLNIKTYSDLRAHPALRFGFSNEFMERGDGWPSLREHYRFPQKDVRGLDHDIAYRALQNGDIDVIDLYSTDAEIRFYDLAVLEDDLQHFPRYDAVVLYRTELAKRSPPAVAAIRSLEGRIGEQQMIAMNARAKLDRVPAATVAVDFLEEQSPSGIVGAAAGANTARHPLMRTTIEHLSLVVRSMLPAIIVAIPLGILAAKRRRLAQSILGVVGIVQTIPALALLVLLMRPLSAAGFASIGDPPALVALFLYSLLPIVRNTYAGLHEIPPHLRESADALGLHPWTCLWRIELPLASRMILAGVKTAVVLNIGFATLGALIGAGGYGQPILTGIRLDDYGLIMRGAVPAAAMALAAQGGFELVERWCVPRGLRLRRV
ncbi:MAG: ABC transporter permease subunit [Planctomycetota bacterium]|nr:MAG: ABC transporter permease subunit [Planctomycetota bacterium]